MLFVKPNIKLFPMTLHDVFNASVLTRDNIYVTSSSLLLTFKNEVICICVWSLSTMMMNDGNSN